MHWSIIWDYRDALYQGLVHTMALAGVAIPGSLLLGLALGCLASVSGWLPRELVTLYVAPLRNLPVVVKLFFFYFVLGLDAWLASVVTLVLHHSAYIADITRAGARSVPREQFEAARACGHTYLQAFRYVLLPQIIRIIIPSLTSQFIDVVKNSSLCMLIELTFQIALGMRINSPTRSTGRRPTISAFIVCVKTVLPGRLLCFPHKPVWLVTRQRVRQ